VLSLTATATPSQDSELRAPSHGLRATSHRECRGCWLVAVAVGAVVALVVFGCLFIAFLALLCFPLALGLLLGPGRGGEGGGGGGGFPLGRALSHIQALAGYICLDFRQCVLPVLPRAIYGLQLHCLIFRFVVRRLSSQICARALVSLRLPILSCCSSCGSRSSVRFIFAESGSLMCA
jgi:hypothetical protein